MKNKTDMLLMCMNNGNVLEFHHLLHTTYFCCENFMENWSTDRFSQCFEGRFEGL